MSIGVVPCSNVCERFLQTTLKRARLSARHRYNKTWFDYQDGLEQLSTDFNVAVDLPTHAVRDLATNQLAVFSFSELPEV